MNEDEELKGICRHWWTAGFWSGAAIASSAWTMVIIIGLVWWVW